MKPPKTIQAAKEIQNKENAFKWPNLTATLGYGMPDISFEPNSVFRYPGFIAVLSKQPLATYEGIGIVLASIVTSLFQCTSSEKQ